MPFKLPDLLIKFFMHLTKSCSTTNMYTFSVHQRLKSRIDRRSLNQWVYQWLTAVFESQLYPDLVLLSWIWCCTDDDDDYDAISNRMCMSKRRVVYLSDDESAVREHHHFSSTSVFLSLLFCSSDAIACGMMFLDHSWNLFSKWYNRVHTYLFFALISTASVTLMSVVGGRRDIDHGTCNNVFYRQINSRSTLFCSGLSIERVMIALTIHW